MSANSIKLHPSDNVAIAIREIAAGETCDAAGQVRATETIPPMHKIALEEIATGAVVRKYSNPIGSAITPIKAGDHVHTQNCAIAELERDYQFGENAKPTDFVAIGDRAQFDGYHRPNGKVGTRNYIAIISSVNCSATVSRAVADYFHGDRLAEFENVDGVIALTQSGGCSISPQGESFKVLQRVLAGYARHPNIGGVLFIGLGCEAMQIGKLKEAYGFEESDLFRSYAIQDMGGTRIAIDVGIAHIKEMLPIVNRSKRKPAPASELILAVQCGGSDGFSGITANPALGAAVDRLVRQGGAGVLSETTELYGAEHMLINRAASREVGEKLIERIAWWKNYTQRNNETIDSNPSPGNKAGGLTTILEKSLGAQAKGGTTNLNAVYEYAEPITERGLVLMDGPGYDPASVTGQVASGATIVCFTTGRGSVFGYKPTPTLKLATNSDLFKRMRDDMDINCGDIVTGAATIESKGEEIFNEVLNVASGKKTKSELLGYGDNEFVPWNIGATT